MEKVCSMCEKVKDISQYNKKGKTSSGAVIHRSECRDCSKIQRHQQYHKDREVNAKKINENRLVRVRENREKFFNIKKAAECVDCGYNQNPLAISFVSNSYIDGGDQTGSISKMIADGSSWDRINSVIEKCVPKCANCERIETAKKQGWYKNLE